MIKTKECLLCKKLRWRLELPEKVLLCHQIKGGMVKSTPKLLVKTPKGSLFIAYKVLDLTDKNAEWKWVGLNKSVDKDKILWKEIV